MDRKRIMAMIIMALILMGLKLPQQNEEYLYLPGFMKAPQETDIENPRADSPRRKASERKIPWLNQDNLLDMENSLGPATYTLAPNWYLPAVDSRGNSYNTATQKPPALPGEPQTGTPISWYFAGCDLMCPATAECGKPFT